LCQILPVSLDCPFLFASFSFSNVYCQFLWIVHSCLPHSVSLTFIAMQFFLIAPLFSPAFVCGRNGFWKWQL
jgi:hypothetical protein